MASSGADFDASPYISIVPVSFTLHIRLGVYYSQVFEDLDLEHYRHTTSVLESSGQGYETAVSLAEYIVR